MKRLLLLGGCLLLLVNLSFAQEQYGNIRGRIVDIDGSPLPGVTVTVYSEFGTKTQITSENGSYRFINLSTGTYELRAELPGFNTYLQRDIVIQIGTNRNIDITMEVAKLAEEVTVIGETPMVDTKRTSVSTNVSTEHLQELPSSRDPWHLLTQLPGTVAGSENVGGSESGMQSGLGGAKGAVSGSGIYNMDGVTITDGSGGSPAYYDFDSFAQVEVSQAGHDASVKTGGTSINFITNRGSNNFQAQFHVYYTAEDLQGDNLTDEVRELGYEGDKINMIADYGLQLGGPIIKDRLWIWAGGGLQDIRKWTINRDPNNVKIQAMNFKLNADITNDLRAEFGWIFDEKAADGRGASIYVTRDSSYLQEGPARQFKLEFQYTLSSNFLLSLKGSAFPSWWALTPIGGLDTQVAHDDVTGRYWDSYYGTHNGVDSYGARADGNLFVEQVLNADHEFSFGVEWRYLPRYYTATYGGDAMRIFSDGVPYQARVYRERDGKYYFERYSAYLQDAVSFGNLTVNLGARFDHEHTWVGKSQIGASQVAPDLLPGIDWEGEDPGDPTTWGTFSPRFGLTYDIFGDSNTILKISAAQYGNTMDDGYANHISAVSMAYAQYYWNDLNGDSLVSQSELVGFPYDGLILYSSFDPFNPTNLDSPNIFADDTSSPKTNELIVGVEQGLGPDFSLRGNLFLRKNFNFYWDRPIGVTNDNYLGPVTGDLTYDGETYSYEYWYLDQMYPVGEIRENRPDYYQNYSAFEVAADKRMSNKWMMNASFTLQRSTPHYGDEGFVDPTNIGYRDGYLDEYQAEGVTWMTKLTWLYQLPWGINFSGFAQARQGKLHVPYIRVDAPEREGVAMGSRVDVLTEPVGENRMDTFYQLDIRFGKDVMIGQYGKFNFSVDIFNLFNNAHVLYREEQLNRSSAGYPEAILKPRVVRFSIRYKF
jgi:hypothetical protein